MKTLMSVFLNVILMTAPTLADRDGGGGNAGPDFSGASILGGLDTLEYSVEINDWDEDYNRTLNKAEIDQKVDAKIQKACKKWRDYAKLKSINNIETYGLFRSVYQQFNDKYPEELNPSRSSKTQVKLPFICKRVDESKSTVKFVLGKSNAEKLQTIIESSKAQYGFPLAFTQFYEVNSTTAKGKALVWIASSKEVFRDPSKGSKWDLRLNVDQNLDSILLREFGRLYGNSEVEETIMMKDLARHIIYSTNERPGADQMGYAGNVSIDELRELVPHSFYSGKKMKGFLPNSSRLNDAIGSNILPENQKFIVEYHFGIFPHPTVQDDILKITSLDGKTTVSELKIINGGNCVYSNPEQKPTRFRIRIPNNGLQYVSTKSMECIFQLATNDGHSSSNWFFMNFGDYKLTSEMNIYGSQQPRLKGNEGMFQIGVIVEANETIRAKSYLPLMEGSLSK